MSEFAVARQNMVESQVRASGVTDPRVIAAMQAVPREAFVPEARQTLAYLGEDLRVRDAEGGVAARYLMEPRTIAKLAELADVQAADLVLDIGPATGYSTAVFARLADTVVAVECDHDLAEFASKALQKLGADNAVVTEGALADGNAKQGPFDVIVLNGAVSEVPQSLLDQLKEGGRLVAVVRDGSAGKARLYTKFHGTIGQRDGFDAGTRLLPGFEKVATFSF
ncbi:MAG: protein-L-isoaspartate O-methyltransferase [Parvibaculum sp.]